MKVGDKVVSPYSWCRQGTLEKAHDTLVQYVGVRSDTDGHLYWLPIVEIRFR